MSLKKRGKIFHYTFERNGKTFYGSTKCTVERDAQAVEDRRIREEEDKIRDRAKSGIPLDGRLRPEEVTFDYAFTRYMREVGNHRADKKTIETDHARIMDFLIQLGLAGKNAGLADLTDDHVAQMVTWRREQRVEIARKNSTGPLPTDKLVEPATVNRSVTGRLMAIFTRARTIWLKGIQVPFPNEPVWAEHKLEEPKERVRISTQEEHDALRSVINMDYELVRVFAIATGLRMDNCLIKKSQINTALGFVTVIGKGNKTINQPLTPLAKAIIQQCWSDHGGDELFTYRAQRTVDGRVKGQRYPITSSGMATEWRRARAEAAKICPSLISADQKTTFRFHDHRHTFATNLLQRSGNMRLVQKGLSHSKGETTEKYAHVFNPELVAAMNDAEARHYLTGLMPQRLLPPPVEDQAIA